MQFSIVTLSYNQSEYLSEAIRSVISQRSGAVEVEYIVVDPGSEDRSRAIIQEFTDDIDLAILEPDAGPADGLNKAFAASTGEVLGFINADDYLEPGALQLVADRLTDCTAEGLVGSMRIVDHAGRPVRWSPQNIGSVQYPSPYELRRVLDRATSFQQPSTFIRRSAWDRVAGFNARNQVSWDAELFIDLLLAGVEFRRTSSVLASFRIHDQSITGSERSRGEIAAERARLVDRIMSSGVHPSRAIFSVLRRLWWRIRPITRLRGLAAGLRHRHKMPSDGLST